MNYLAHLHLARQDNELMLGGLLGDFVRGAAALATYPPGIQQGIELHRHIDSYTDQLPVVRSLRQSFPAGFQRYAGIITDIAFDHELARRWDEYGDIPLQQFDQEVRDLVLRAPAPLPDALHAFMAYADRHGLFAAYRDEAELLITLHGVGRRMRHANPLHEVDGIWPSVRASVRVAFTEVYPQLQSEVGDWLKSRSTTTGSWSEAPSQGYAEGMSGG